ncbi:MAG: type II secretion system protein [Candidatus Omnitrophica bacterium]|nr:type II secretion system protein [Candidatus Omnitrophota bacterium]
MIHAISCRKGAFTLIELLIVVAIIGILAAMAAPNFLNAQIRAKISRAQSDLRTIRQAASLYAADHNEPPPSTHPALGDSTIGYLRFNITTPTAYLQNGFLPDPFVNQRDPDVIAKSEQFYTYQNMIYNIPRGSFPIRFFDVYGNWRACSYGPDRTYFDGPYGVTVYDPSNGLVSAGNIWTSDKAPEIHNEPATF